MNATDTIDDRAVAYIRILSDAAAMAAGEGALAAYNAALEGGEDEFGSYAAAYNAAACRADRADRADFFRAYVAAWESRQCAIITDDDAAAADAAAADAALAALEAIAAVAETDYRSRAYRAGTAIERIGTAALIWLALNLAFALGLALGIALSM